MKIQEVISREDEKQFLLLPVKLYKKSPHWIRPLDKDIEGVFDTKKNKAFRHGECIRWILKSDLDETIGRIAAFVDKKTADKGNEQHTGGLGFFECIESREAAFLLFDQAKQWLQTRGMEAMDGPINFGSKDRWWGLLVVGYDRDPNYQCNYNFPYYQEFFESYGFKVYFQHFTFGRKVMDPLTPRIREKADLVAKDPNYSFRHLKKSEVSKLAEYIRIIYNKAWANRAETPELSTQQAALIVKQMKPIMDLRLLYFGFYKEEPIAFYLSLPEINQVFKYVNGKLDLIGKMIFLWHQFRKTNRKAFGVLFGIVPEHQGSGADGGIIYAARDILQENYRRYDEYEVNWIGDFNPKMILLVQQVGGDKVKIHHTYRKLFDETKPFKRHPMLR